MYNISSLWGGHFARFAVEMIPPDATPMARRNSTLDDAKHRSTHDIRFLSRWRKLIFDGFQP